MVAVNWLNASVGDSGGGGGGWEYGIGAVGTMAVVLAGATVVLVGGMGVTVVVGAEDDMVSDTRLLQH
jgi:hypothetical protein